MNEKYARQLQKFLEVFRGNRRISHQFPKQPWAKHLMEGNG